MMKKLLLTLCLTFFTFTFSFSQNFRFLSFSGNDLVTVNPATGDAELIKADFPIFNILDFIYHPVHQLYYFTAGANITLYSMDPCSYEITRIGIITEQSNSILYNEVLAYNPDDQMVYIAYGTDGTLADKSNKLGTINLNTGAISFMSNITETIQNEADGLEFVGSTAYLIDANNSVTNFYTIDVATGVSTFVGNTGYVAMNVITWANNKMYGVTSTSRLLLEINIETGAATEIGATHASTEFDGSIIATLVYGLHQSPVEFDGLYGFIGNDFVVLNETTGVASLLREDLIQESPRALNYVPSEKIFYFLNMENTSDVYLMTLDTCLRTSLVGKLSETGNTTNIAPAEGMAYDAVNNRMFISYGNTGPSFLSPNLGIINLTDGSINRIGSFTNSVNNEMDALGFIGGQLFGIDVDGTPSHLYSINITNAGASYIALIEGHNNATDLTYDELSDKLYAAVPLTRNLITINQSTAEPTLVGSTSSSSDFGGGNFTSITSTRPRVTEVINSNVSKVGFANNITVNPSPADEFVVVNSSGNEQLLFRLTSLSGIQVISENISSNGQQIDVSRVEPGLYYYQIISSNQVYNSGKLMIR